uniref:Uncharacterized protein n=1 Tax=Arundo donax TaxID=35708 RepID=A0A0A9BSS5_ARUDO
MALSILKSKSSCIYSYISAQKGLVWNYLAGRFICTSCVLFL